MTKEKSRDIVSILNLRIPYKRAIKGPKKADGQALVLSQIQARRGRVKSTKIVTMLESYAKIFRRPFTGAKT